MARYTFEDAYFISNAWYDGLGESEYNGIIDWLDGAWPDEYGFYHENITKVKHLFPNSVELLQVLVLMFGDYGVSPRVGWIEQPNEASAWLKIKRDEHWKHQ